MTTPFDARFLDLSDHSSLDHTGIPGIDGVSAYVGVEVIESDAEFFTGAIVTKTIPQGTLTDDDQSLEIVYHAHSGTSGVPTLVIAADGNTILTHVFGAIGREAQYRIQLIRTGATTCRSSASVVEDGGTNETDTATFTFDWSVARDITFTFSSGTDEEHRLYRVVKWPHVGAGGLPGVGSDTLPIGVIVPFGGTIASVPTGFLPCDGSEASRTDYADLFTVFGTIWGVGDGSLTFGLPDFRARSPLGQNNGDLPNGEDGGFATRNLADEGGTETHTLTEAQMPVHNHAQTLGGATGSTAPPEANLGDGSTSTSTNTQNAGSGDAHPIMHPFTVVAYIVKARKIGGGTGTTAQVSGGALQGAQPTLNFIPTGSAGVTVVENVPENRIDITIDAAAGGLISANTARGSADSFGTNFVLTGGPIGSTDFHLGFAFLGWNDTNDCISMGFIDGSGGTSEKCLTVALATSGFDRSGIAIGATLADGSTAVIDFGAGAPECDRDSGSDSFMGVAAITQLNT